MAEAVETFYQLDDYDLNEVLEILEKEGYSSKGCYTRRTSGKYVLVIVPFDEEDAQDGMLYKEMGYEVGYFEDSKSVATELSCITCGGHYVCGAVYSTSKGHPRYFEGEANLSSKLPKGDRRIKFP